MRLPLLLMFLPACHPSGPVPSDHGPDMVYVPGNIAALGRPPLHHVNTAHGAAPSSPPQGPNGMGQGFSTEDIPRGQLIPLTPNGGPGGSQPDINGLATRRLDNPEPLEPRDVWVDGFWIDVTEITRAQYAEFLKVTGYRVPWVDEAWAREGWNWNDTAYPEGTADHPVVLTNWYDAREYCAWAGKRLPTEAEWQLAVLGPAKDEGIFPWGDTYDASFLNHGSNNDPWFDPSDGYWDTSPVGSFPQGASRYGLLDAFGNAWEWTSDLRVQSWDEMVGGTHRGMMANPHTGKLGIYVAMRGGCYFFDLSVIPHGERSASLAELRRKTNGLRCARDG